MLDNIFEFIWLIGFVTGSVIRAVHRSRIRSSKITANHETRSDVLLVVLAGTGMIVLPLFYLLTPWLEFANYQLPEWAGWVGTAIFATSLWLLWIAHSNLGHNWSAKLEIKENHLLVTKGIYRYIRHPMYAAHWLWGIAQVLLLKNWIAGFSFLAFFAPLYFLRVPREERMMLEHFGEEYHLYMNRTRRIIPRFSFQKQG